MFIKIVNNKNSIIWRQYKTFYVHIKKKFKRSYYTQKNYIKNVRFHYKLIHLKIKCTFFTIEPNENRAPFKTFCE